MLSHTYGRPGNKMHRLFIVAVKLAIIAVTIMVIGASSTLAPVSHAALSPLQVKALSGGATTAASDAGNSPASVPGRPVAEMLNADGTLNLDSGFNGSLDMAGWKMASGPGGAPRFVPAVAGDEN